MKKTRYKKKTCTFKVEVPVLIWGFKVFLHISCNVGICIPYAPQKCLKTHHHVFRPTFGVECLFFLYIVTYIKASEALYWFHGCNVNVLWFYSGNISESDLSLWCLITYIRLSTLNFNNTAQGRTEIKYCVELTCFEICNLIWTSPREIILWKNLFPPSVIMTKGLNFYDFFIAIFLKIFYV